MPFSESFPVFPHPHLLGIDHLSLEDIKLLLDRASVLSSAPLPEHKSNLALFGRTQVNLFYEASTRTRSSFEIAGKRLGMNVINLPIEHSSVKKGENFLDTLLTLNAMKPDVLVLRHFSSGAAIFASKYVSCSLINAGDGFHEHPSQALIDALVVQKAKGRISGLIIVICGDILHSRVARSNIILFKKLGAHIRVIAPSALLPSGIRHMGVDIFPYITPQAIENADIIMTLRVQQERMVGSLIPCLKEYFRYYGIDEKKLLLAKSDALVMHPGPINRGVEIASSLANSKSKSLILKQVESGVPLRMAIMLALLDPRKNTRQVLT